MSASSQTDLDAGQAVPSLARAGEGDFDSLISGGNTGASGKGMTSTETVAKPATSDKPELTQSTPAKSADEAKTGAQAGQGGQQADAGQQQSQQQTQQQVAAPATGGIDKAVLDQIVDTAARAAAKAANPEVSDRKISKDQDDLTPEQFNAKYGIETITEQHIQRLLDQDPKKAAAALNQMFIKNLGSSALMAKDIAEVHIRKALEKVQPELDWARSYRAEQAERKLEEEFYTTYKDLVNEKPLVKEMQSAIFGRIASGQLKPFNSPQDALKAVAEATRALVQKMGRQSASGQQNQQSQTQSQGQGQQSSSRQMTAASTAGQSGSGKTAGQSDVEKIFGEDFK